MSVKTAHALPPFWLILVAAWLPVVTGVAIAASTALGRPNALLNHALFLCGYVLATIPLGLAYRTLWYRSASWTASVLIMFVLSLLVAFVSTTLLIWTATHLGSVPGNFQWSYVFGSLDSIWFVLLAFCAMIMVVGYYVSMKQAQLRATTATALAHEAELRALRYQLHPHFLFNTLNAISTLVVEKRTSDATRMIARLGDLLRATLEGGGRHEVSLADELAITEHYLEIEKARLGDRLKVTMRIGPDTLRASVPWLLLQPLAENAIRHGIAPRRAGGQLTVQASRSDDRLKLEVCNDGIAAASQPSSGEADPSSSVGLRNVRERLQRLYADNHRFEFTLAADGSCRVRMDLPFRATPDDQAGAEQIA
ncbi:MAG: histidine kinase [Rhodanobacteraceae bacterium]